MANLPNDIYQPQTRNETGSPSVLIVTTDNTEDLEFFYPYYRFIEEGIHVDVATPKGAGFKCKHGIELKTSKKIADMKAETYDMLYLPGGKAPEALKSDKDALALVKKFVELAKPIAAICHGPQLLAAADVVAGKKLSAWPEVEKELQDAGAAYLNREVLTDGLFTTARWPGDLPAHMKAVLEHLRKGNSRTNKMASAA